ncbi:efflux transporter outer membrane subunit [Kingella negevensis]|uniref:efflux transporter outer membrane subunit n=1 Tax=Kingella negevensis TaxID=1522312 RepID=UPI00050A0CCD|nr:TolC family protein [Kingella negevensis]
MTNLKTLSGCILLALSLSACQNTQINTQSQITVPSAFNHAQAAQSQNELASWWKNWHDPVLNQLIEQGLQNSPDVKIALSRLNEARANARLAQTDLGAQVGLNGTVSVTRGNVDNPLSGSTRSALATNPLTAPLSGSDHTIKGTSTYGGFAASWEPDIFGGKRSDVDAARAAALGVQEQFYGAQVLLSGDIAEQYFQARALQLREQAAEQSIAALERMAQYVQGRFRAGLTTAYEVDEVNSKLSAMRGKYATLQTQFDQRVRNIAVLIGETPQTFRLPESTQNALLTPPAAPYGETPQDIINRRPDLRVRAAQVQAYAAKLASAKADLLPRFTINFLGQGGRFGISGDESVKGWASLFSVGIQTPLFTNGRIHANIDAADARLKTTLLEYDQALLQALADTDSAYQFQAALAQQNQLLQQAQQQSAKQAADAQTLFRYGSKTLDYALTSRVNAAQAQENLAQGQLAQAQALVGLYKSLGGGWAVSQ